jgi:hypothetical protein
VTGPRGVRPPWWSPKDEADLEVVVAALTDTYFEHRERCAACAEERRLTGLPCTALRQEIERVASWAERRHARLRAAWWEERERRVRARLRARARALLAEEEGR